VDVPPFVEEHKSPETSDQPPNIVPQLIVAGPPAIIVPPVVSAISSDAVSNIPPVTRNIPPRTRAEVSCFSIYLSIYQYICLSLYLPIDLNIYLTFYLYHLSRDRDLKAILSF